MPALRAANLLGCGAFVLLGLLAGASVQAQVPAQPQADPELKGLQDELAAVQDEQQALYQQFTMTQGMLDNEIREQQQSAYGGGLYAPIQNYDDVQRQTRERNERVQQYIDGLRQLYARHAELNERKAAIRERIYQLLQSRSAR